MRYTTLAAFKAYGQVTVSTEDGVLSEAVDRAESKLEAICGTSFAAQSVTEQVYDAFVDQAGWLWLTVRAAAPLTALSSLTLRNLRDTPTVVDTVTWAANNILLPFVPSDPIRPDARWWTAQLLPVNGLPALTPTDVLVTATYTAGFNVVPNALRALVHRLAWWYYKLREAPLGRVTMPELGIIDIPQAVPADVLADLNQWRRIG